MTTAVAKAEPTALATLLADPDKLREFPIETVERLFALDREMRNDAAKVDYATAFNAVQADMTPVRKAGHNPSTKSNYALAEHIDEMLQPLLIRHGFSTSFSEEPTDKPETVRLVMTVRHNGGHTELHRRDVPFDYMGMRGNPTKTKLHGSASAETYAKRRLKCAVFDIQLGDDDDGNAGGGGPGAEKISEAICQELLILADDVGADKVMFCRWLGVDSFADIRVDQLDLARRGLEKKRDADA